MADFFDDAPKPPPKTGWGMSLLRGIGDMGAMGWQDEIQALIQAATPQPGDPASFGERYRRQLEAARQDVAKAKEDNPGVYTLGQGVGLLGSLGFPVATAGRAGQGLPFLTRAARAALPGAVTGGIYGGLSAAGHSEADTPQGVMQDTLHGAAIGAPFGAAGGVVGEALGGAAASRAAYAREKQTAAVDKALRQKRSSLGGEVQGGSRSGENIERLGLRQQLTPEEATKLAALEARVGTNTIEELGPQLQRVDKAQEIYNEAVANYQKDIEAGLSWAAARARFGEHMKRYGIPMAIGGLMGSGFGLPGIGAGALGGLAIRPQLRAMGRTLWTHPATVTRLTVPALRAGEKASGKAAGPILSGAAFTPPAPEKPKKKEPDSFFDENQPSFFDLGVTKEAK